MPTTRAQDLRAERRALVVLIDASRRMARMRCEHDPSGASQAMREARAAVLELRAFDSIHTLDDMYETLVGEV